MQASQGTTVDQIAATLAAWDVPYLMASDMVAPLRVTGRQLLSLLAESSESRVNEALIPLLLRYPALHAHVLSLVNEDLGKSSSEKLRAYYTASAYLQRYCWTLLSSYVVDSEPLPDYFGVDTFGLKEPLRFHGESGLRQLGQLLKEQTGQEWFGLFMAALTLSLAMLRVQQSHESNYAELPANVS